MNLLTSAGVACESAMSTPRNVLRNVLFCTLPLMCLPSTRWRKLAALPT